MIRERIGVRLDAESRRKLTEILERRHVSASIAIREAIDELYEADVRQSRIEAAERIGAMSVEDVPDPDELSRQLAETYDIGPLYRHERPDLRKRKRASA